MQAAGAIYLALPMWFLLILAVYLFRDPERIVPAVPLAIVSPIDGYVTKIESIQDTCLHRPAKLINVLMHSQGVFTVRSPTEGLTKERWVGTCDEQKSDKQKQASILSVWLQTDEEDDVVLVVRGNRIHKPKCGLIPGERIGQGQRCGFALFARDIDIILPEETKVNVQIGEKVVGGASVLGHFKHY